MKRGQLEQIIIEAERWEKEILDIAQGDVDKVEIAKELECYGYTVADLKKFFTLKESTDWFKPIDELEEEIYTYLTCLAG